MARQLYVSLSELAFTIVASAFNGQELLEKLKQLSRLPDICVLDISMPVMDGYETARQLKVFYPDINILAFSMDDDEQTVTAIKKAGANAFIWKCCEPQKLKEAIVSIRNSL